MVNWGTGNSGRDVVCRVPTNACRLTEFCVNLRFLRYLRSKISIIAPPINIFLKKFTKIFAVLKKICNFAIVFTDKKNNCQYEIIIIFQI
jgi:hypothetical protein